MESVLWRYCHLFYGIGSTDIGCVSLVQHTIETGHAKPVKKNPYRIPHALKPVMDEHIDGMLKKKKQLNLIHLRGVVTLSYCKRGQRMEVLNTDFA